jgi:hypothetical protein
MRLGDSEDAVVPSHESRDGSSPTPNAFHTANKEETMPIREIAERTHREPTSPPRAKVFLALCVWVLLAGIAIATASPSGDATDFIERCAIRDTVIHTEMGAWRCSPALADLDGDGDLEIIVGGSAFHHDGHPLAGWPCAPNSFTGAAAVASMGKPEEIEVAYDGRIYRADGSIARGWEQRSGKGAAPMSLDDVDGDGFLETLYVDGAADICVRKLDGNYLPGWPCQVPGGAEIGVPPLARDINGDNEKEIILVCGDRQRILLYGLRGKLLRELPLPGVWVNERPFAVANAGKDKGWELLCGGWGVFLGDGKQEQLPVDFYDGAPCWIPWKQSRTVLVNAALPDNALPTPSDIPTDADCYGQGAVAGDIDGDGNIEVLFGNRGGGFHAYRLDGAQATGWPKRLHPGGDSAMAIGDLDGNGALDVVAVTDRGNIYVFDCPGSVKGQVPWPLFMGDNKRSGVPQEVPAAKQKPLAAGAGGASVEAFHKALVAGKWDDAIKLFSAALSTVESPAAQGGMSVAERNHLQQIGLLSIARILNTRARRFEEAAEYYRGAFEKAPHTWEAWQALGECLDMAELYPEKKKCADALKQMLAHADPSQPTFSPVESAACRFLQARALNALNRDEDARNTLRTLESASPAGGKALNAAESRTIGLYRDFAKKVLTYGKATFRMNMTEMNEITLVTLDDEVKPIHGASSSSVYKLLVTPNSEFRNPFALSVGAMFPERSTLKSDVGNWKKQPDGSFRRAFQQTLSSVETGREVTNWIELGQTIPTSFPLQVRRECGIIGKGEMRVRLTITTQHPVDFSVKAATGTELAPQSVSPRGGNYTVLHPSEIRYSTSAPASGGSPKPAMGATGFSKGATYEFTVKELPGSAMFQCPQITVSASFATPRQAVGKETRELKGRFQDCFYTLSSPDLFRLEGIGREARFEAVLMPHAVRPEANPRSATPR